MQTASLARAVELLGQTGIIGVGLLVFGAVFYFGTVRPADVRLADLRAEQARLEQIRDQKAREGKAGVSTEERLRDFYDMLAREQAIGGLLEKIDAAARRNGINLRQGNYRFSWDSASRSGRCEITYTGQAQYFRVRVFLHEVLSEMPMVSLDEVSFQRQQAAVGTTDLSARFSILVRRES